MSFLMKLWTCGGILKLKIPHYGVADRRWWIYRTIYPWWLFKGMDIFLDIYQTQLDKFVYKYTHMNVELSSQTYHQWQTNSLCF